MKKIRLLSLLLASLLLACALVGCGGKESKGTVQLVFKTETAQLINVSVEIDKEDPTVNEVVQAAIAQYETFGETIFFDEENIDVKTVKDIDAEYTAHYDEETKTIYGWEFYINAEKDPRSGRADDVKVAAGDTITYSFYAQAYNG